MDYGKHYGLLVDRARARAPSGYMERHHVVPRCMGGTDDPDNLVLLTPEEHYTAHQLLVKMNPGNYRLVYAACAMAMANGKHQRRGNKLYGWLRRRLPEELDAAHKARISAGKKGKQPSAAHLEAVRAAKERRQDAEAAKLRAKYAKWLPKRPSAA